MGCGGYQKQTTMVLQDQTEQQVHTSEKHERAMRQDIQIIDEIGQQCIT
ncbi:hypothetical protein pb186bvf_016188 [Paramecium bursaria]